MDWNDEMDMIEVREEKRREEEEGGQKQIKWRWEKETKNINETTSRCRQLSKIDWLIDTDEMTHNYYYFNTAFAWESKEQRVEGNAAVSQIK